MKYGHKYNLKAKLFLYVWYEVGKSENFIRSNMIVFICVGGGVISNTIKITVFNVFMYGGEILVKYLNYPIYLLCLRGGGVYHILWFLFPQDCVCVFGMSTFGLMWFSIVL